MIQYAEYYVDTGEIICTGMCPESSLHLKGLDDGVAVIVGAASDLDDYVKDSQIVSKGPQPSPAHHFNYSTGQWEFDITDAKSQKWAEIKAARDAQEFDTFDWSGYTFQCDEVSQRRIQGAVQLATLDPDMTLEWTLADNSSQVFSGADYVAIGQALAIHVSACHARGRILREQINQASNQSDLEAINW